jgi:hypothetical protein
VDFTLSSSRSHSQCHWKSWWLENGTTLHLFQFQMSFSTLTNRILNVIFFVRSFCFVFLQSHHTHYSVIFWQQQKLVHFFS